MASRWLNRTVVGIGLASLCSDVGHEMATTAMPALLASLGASSAILGLIEGTADGQPLLGNFRSTRVYQRLSNGLWQLTNFEATRIRPGHNHDQANAEPTASPPAN